MPGLPGLAHDLGEAVRAPDRDQVQHRAAGGVDQVLLEQVLAQVHPLALHPKERDVGRPAVEAVEDRVEVGDRLLRVAARRRAAGRRAGWARASARAGGARSRARRAASGTRGRRARRFAGYGRSLSTSDRGGLSERHRVDHGFGGIGTPGRAATGSPRCARSASMRPTPPAPQPSARRPPTGATRRPRGAPCRGSGAPRRRRRRSRAHAAAQEAVELVAALRLRVVVSGEAPRQEAHALDPLGRVVVGRDRIAEPAERAAPRARTGRRLSHASRMIWSIPCAFQTPSRLTRLPPPT